MFSAITHLRTVGLVFFILLGLVVGRLADRCCSLQASAAEPTTKPLDALQAEYDKVLAALKAALPANDARLQRLIALQAERTKALTDRVEHLQAEHAKVRTELEKEKQELEAKLQTALKDAELKMKKLEEKIPLIDLLAYDKPKGKILTVEGQQQTVVHLNLGSADFVKPGLTFSVFGEGEYKPTAERKAALVVVEVTDAHRCRARVTEIKNAARRPIVAGDQLYNPAWTPGLRERVALAGRIDLQCDGRDNTAAFIQALEKEGMIVDAWIDLKDMSVKGARKAITLQTSYLILGDMPDLDEAQAAQLSEAELEKQLTLRQLICEFRDQAIQKGVTVVNARRFMALAGMTLPTPVSESSKKK
ncbi:hypothetical protein AYO44_11015 [Planctomycetaceae bacterium SCGC AG-212-F19]|nr:hypothetical protein AYO44_11015 [Planctomycetaceae bacterium SCGC AG-212-F19]